MIRITRRDGSAVREIPITADDGINACRVRVEGHVNPSVSRYVVWDVARGVVTDLVTRRAATEAAAGAEVPTRDSRHDMRCAAPVPNR